MVNVSTVLGHMLMPSVQRWTDNQCCSCSSHLLILKHQLVATAFVCHSVGFDPTQTWGFVI